jgi:hypothetical protein
VLAMPITVSLKVVFQTVPELNRWAELMSLDWESPQALAALTATAPAPEPAQVPTSSDGVPPDRDRHQEPRPMSPVETTVGAD